MIKDFAGGDMGCARLTFLDKSLHLFPQPRELFPVIPTGQGRRAGQNPRTVRSRTGQVELNLQRRAGQHVLAVARCAYGVNTPLVTHQNHAMLVPAGKSRSG